MTSEIAKLKEWVDGCDNIVFFGGAGVSTESGIPDFRSVDGLYNQQYKYPPETILSHTFFLSETAEFYRFYRAKMLALDAQPNAAHLKLAEWEREGKCRAVVTQNIDGLHQKAGSKEVLELHGSVLRNYCMRCRKPYPVEKIASGTGGSIWSDKPVLAVDIRSGVTGVGKDAFYGCDDLQVISLPDTVTQLDDNAFGNCPALSDILVDAKNPAYKSVDGALYSKDGTVLVKGPANAETFVVPDGVATIGDYAFFGAKYLTSIYFPEGSLTTIGAMAFEFCEGLTELLLPAGVTEIGMYAFAHCSGLRSVDLPVSLKHVSDMAFLSAGTMDAGIADINYAGSEQQWNAIAFDDGVLGWMHKNFNTEQHTFGAWVTDGTRSCEQGVTMARSCGNDGCDLVQTVELPAYGHIWDSGTLLAAPDGVRCGIVEHTCSRCNGTGYEVLDPEIWAYEQFGDVDPTLWSYEGIQFCVMMGYMSGMDTHVFAPRGVTTRAQLVQILYNFVGGPEVSGETPFTDLTANWYKDAVLWAYQTGVTSGTSETTFAPDDPVTREQVAVLLYEFADKVLEVGGAETPADLSRFPDGDQVSSWAREAMADAVALGIINGTRVDDQVFLAPQGSATRDQIATMFEGFCASLA